jgi:hypothetical protein
MTFWERHTESLTIICRYRGLFYAATDLEIQSAVEKQIRSDY